MPFTFSHPAAAVPLARRGLPLSALVVGSMAPDFAYFIPRLPISDHSHTLPGVLLFCVPTGFLVLWVFHTILKYPLLSLLPDDHQKRLIPVAKGFSFRPPRQIVLIVVSLALGALTHVGWDACTHVYGWVGRHFSVLSLPIVETAYGAVRVYTVLQHGSTLFGGALLCYWYARWYSRASVRPVTLPIRLSTTVRSGVVLTMGLGASIVAGLFGLLTAFPAEDFRSIQHFVTCVVVAGVSVLWVELFLFGALWHLLKSGKRVRLV